MQPCLRYAREDWVDPSSRNLDWMKQNTGQDSAHSFVYFPKTVIDGFQCMSIPAGTQVYKGMKGVGCSRVEDSINRASWYSDYESARMYATSQSDVYAFELLTDVHLLNLLDDRNVKLMIDRHIAKIDALGLTDFTIPRWGFNTTVKPPEGISDEIAEKTRTLTRLGYNVSMLVSMTKYQLPEEVRTKYFPSQSYPAMYFARPTNTNPADPNPSELEHVSQEFGNQTTLLRSSRVDTDVFIESILREVITDDRISGYYAPRYQSASHMPDCEGEPIKYFHRELFLFQTKSVLKHNPTNTLDGCNHVEPRSESPFGVSLSNPPSRSPSPGPSLSRSPSPGPSLSRSPSPFFGRGNSRTYRKKSKNGYRKTVSKTRRNGHTGTSK